jgi:DNA-binding LytR/AlgR family response regulator
MKKYFFITDSVHGFSVGADDVVALKSEGNYTRIYLTGGKQILVRCPVYKCAEKLRGETLFEACRGKWVNLAAIEEVLIHDAKRWLFKMGDGVEPIVLSRAASVRMKAMRL